MEKMSYADFIITHHDNAAYNNMLTSCMIDLTYRCSNNCVHCYCVDNNSDKSCEMNTEKIKSILDELKSLGCLWLSFSGGEPFLRKDFMEIYLYAKKLGFIISIMTNATLITEEIAQTLSKYKPIQINVSIYGSNEKTYEAVSRVKGTFNKFRNGIFLLKKYGLNVQLQTILMSVIKDDLFNIQKFSKENGFGYCKFDPFLFNDIYRTQKSYPYRMRPEQIVQLETSDKSRESSWMRFSQKVKEHGFKNAEKPTDCCSTAGISKIHIDPYGNIMGCNLLREPCFNLNDYSLAEAREKLMESLSNILSKKYRDDFKCRECDVRLYCNCCPGVSYIENNNYYSKSQYACEIAHMRDKIFNNKGV